MTQARSRDRGIESEDKYGRGREGGAKSILSYWGTVGRKIPRSILSKRVGEEREAVTLGKRMQN